MTLFSRIVTSYITRQNHRVHDHCKSFHHQFPWLLRTSLERRSNSYSSRGEIRVRAPNCVPTCCSTATLLESHSPSWGTRSQWEGQPQSPALALVSVAHGESSCHGSLHRLLVITIVGVLKSSAQGVLVLPAGSCSDPVRVKSASSSS